MRDLQVRRGDFRDTRLVEGERAQLRDGEVRVRVERFALTSNNVTYAVAGDTIGYWKFFPVDDEWGRVPVWGVGEIVESRVDGVEPGERLYGYFPMAAETVMNMGRVRAHAITEISEQRSTLPPLYNTYQRLSGEETDDGLDAQCLYFPLFITSYAIYDYLLDNAVFGARQIVIGSASSKTALGTAAFLHGDKTIEAEIVGLTSPGNVGFVEGLGYYDRVLAYGAEETLPKVPTAYIDMSGNADLGRTLHHHFGDHLVLSSRVGATHWEDAALGGGGHGALPGAKPEMFFAPSQVLKREAEWGAGKFVAKAREASLSLAGDLRGTIAVERIAGGDALAQTWRDFLDNKVSPTRGIMASLQS